jgi:hypothetical protein
MIGMGFSWIIGAIELGMRTETGRKTARNGVILIATVRAGIFGYSMESRNGKLSSQLERIDKGVETETRERHLLLLIHGARPDGEGNANLSKCNISVNSFEEPSTSMIPLLIHTASQQSMLLHKALFPAIIFI